MKQYIFIALVKIALALFVLLTACAYVVLAERKLVARMQNLIINVDASSGIDGKFQAVCGSPEDANTLGQLLQAGFLYKRYQAQKENPELADLLDQARITPAGDRVTLRMSLSDDQMTSLIRKNTFALKM